MLATIHERARPAGGVERAGRRHARAIGDQHAGGRRTLHSRQAIRHLEKGRVVIFAGGTGNPYFTTDTTAALRACEIDAEAILKATQVDGIYDSDPHANPDATKFDEISYMEVLSRELHVMDSTATTLCMDNGIPIIVFNLHKPGNIDRVLKGEHVGTTVS